MPTPANIVIRGDKPFTVRNAAALPVNHSPHASVFYCAKLPISGAHIVRKHHVIAHGIEGVSLDIYYEISLVFR